jgi:hypothetical protein
MLVYVQKAARKKVAIQMLECTGQAFNSGGKFSKANRLEIGGDLYRGINRT